LPVEDAMANINMIVKHIAIGSGTGYQLLDSDVGSQKLTRKIRLELSGFSEAVRDFFDQQFDRDAASTHQRDVGECCGPAGAAR
jgi:hypothetical protein